MQLERTALIGYKYDQLEGSPYIQQSSADTVSGIRVSESVAEVFTASLSEPVSDPCPKL